MDVLVEKDSKRPVVLNNQVGTSAQKGSVATSDHEASGSGSNSKFSRFDSHSKEEASTLEVVGEDGKRVGRTEGQVLQQLHAHGTAREEMER
jgi:hypothetical protein